MRNLEVVVEILQPDDDAIVSKRQAFFYIKVVSSAFYLNCFSSNKYYNISL